MWAPQFIPCGDSTWLGAGGIRLSRPPFLVDGALGRATWGSLPSGFGSPLPPLPFRPTPLLTRHLLSLVSLPIPAALL